MKRFGPTGDILKQQKSYPAVATTVAFRTLVLESIAPSAMWLSYIFFPPSHFVIFALLLSLPTITGGDSKWDQVLL